MADPKDEQLQSERKACTDRPDRVSREDEQHDQSPESSTPKPETGNPYSIWIILLLVFGTIYIWNSIAKPPRYEIPMMQLVKLIELGNPLRDMKTNEPGPSDNAPFIIVEEGDRKKWKKVKYSQLDDIVIGPYEVNGKVVRQILQTKENAKLQKPATVSFCSGRQGLNFDNNELFNRLKENGFENVSAKGEPGFMEKYGTALLTIAGLLILFFFLLRRLGMGAIAFGRNRDIQVSPEDIHVSFDDVAGVEEAVEELREIVDFLRRPEKFRVLGGRIPKGVLLVGPPGTGKTLIAKAVAGEAGVPFFSLSGSDFVELYAGVGAARVRDLFQQAQKSSPCIVFIDELDALGKARSGNSFAAHDEREQTLNALLVEMDGFSTNTGTIVMAATNRPEILDSALLRSGRFDRQVLVDRPDIGGREDILKIHSKQVKLNESADLRQIASITSGFVGADLAALVNEAALLAARAGKDSVTMEEFNEAVERVTSGLQKKRRVMTLPEKKRVSYHECGHALAACLLPNSDPVHKVSIIPRGMAALGYTLQRADDERFLMTKSELETRIQILLAGTIAEEIVFNDISTGAQSDLERATEIARSMVMNFGMSQLGKITFRDGTKAGYGENTPFIISKEHSERTAAKIDREVYSIIDSLYYKTKELLAARRCILDRLAERLLEKEVMDTEELKAVIKEKEDETVPPPCEDQQSPSPPE